MSTETVSPNDWTPALAREYPVMLLLAHKYTYARIEELEAAVNDLMALLPPERWDLIRPPTRDIIRQINDRENSDHE